MLGRMPLIDMALKYPYAMPEIALWIDKNATVDMDFHSLLISSERLAEADINLPEISIDVLTREILSVPVDSRLQESIAIFPSEIQRLLLHLYRGLSAASSHRNHAFDRLTPEDRGRLKTLIPGYFIKKQENSESIRGYTTEIDDCVALIELLRKVDFEEFIWGAHLFAVTVDDTLRLLRDSNSQLLFVQEKPIRIETSLGQIIIAGTGDDTHDTDAAILIDFGGNDTYSNHAAYTDLDTSGGAVLIDVSGDDVYDSEGNAQASACAGYAALIDMAGDDRYLSRHYSQGAALVGYALFSDDSGDDVYLGDFGVQGFAIFGTSLFLDKAGRDSYRCAAMGQAAASTLGVAILVEGDGDDVFRAGGKYDFYFPWDSSCAQGAGSGMRAWPPQNAFSVYGGTGVLLEKAGNDSYTAYNVGQGGSYMFATGILVESDGDDVFSSKNYCRGVGVHLSAAVALDLRGNDIHTGLYGQNGYSLDRSSGVFVDFEGNDIYRTTGGIGFAHKPRGTGIFLDVSGSDIYAGTENNYGKADVPFADDQFSSGFFMDWGNDDVYSSGPYGNDDQWSEGQYGHGEDSQSPCESDPLESVWSPQIEKSDGLHHVSTHPIVRNQMIGDLINNVPASFPDILTLASSSRWQDRMILIDLLPLLRSLQVMDQIQSSQIVQLLNLDDRDVLLAVLMDLSNHPRILEENLESNLINLCRNSAFYEVRCAAGDSLASCSPASETTLRTLTDSLSDPDWRVRRRAAISFGKIQNPSAFAGLMSAIRDDPSFQVRAHAVNSAVKLDDPRTDAFLSNALTDPSPLVRCIAARTLIIEKKQVEPFGVFVELWNWDSRILRETWMLSFLNEFCGQSFKDQDELQLWIEKHQNKRSFKKFRTVYNIYQEVKRAKNTGNKVAIFEGLEKILKIDPEHQFARSELSMELNDAAWQHAVKRTDLKAARKLAERSVKLDANPMNRDTLSVIIYLDGNKQEAIDYLAVWRDNCRDENEREMIESRHQEFIKGDLQLR